MQSFPVSFPRVVRVPLLCLFRHRRALALAGLVGLLCYTLLSTPASAARLRGRVVGFKLLRNPVWTEAADPNRHLFSFREVVPTVPAEARQLYPNIPKELCIAALSTVEQKAPPPVLIRVGGGRTTPVTIVVPPMTRLRFQNTDPFSHRLYGPKIPAFKPSETMRGGSREWTVSEPGVFEIRDEAAPSLRMWVVAEPRVATIAYPSLDGDFALNIAEPGEYEIQAYFAGKKVGEAAKFTVDQNDINASKAPLVVAKPEKKE